MRTDAGFLYDKFCRAREPDKRNTLPYPEIVNTSKTDVNLNYIPIYNLNSYVTENTACVRYTDQPVNTVKEIIAVYFVIIMQDT